MFKITIVVFRECLEIALLLGVILAATRQVEKSRIYVIAGIMLGTVTASIFAFFTRTISLAFAGTGDEIFNSIVILLSTIMIASTIIWMHGYGTKVKQSVNHLTTRIKSGSNSCIMLVLLVALTVLREATEIIILLYGIATFETLDSNSYIQGLIIGATCGFALGTIIYLGFVKLASQQLIFKISSILLTLIAGGFAANAAGILTASGIITVLSQHLWDSSWLISDISILGRLLNMTTGYIAKPNGLQVIFYFSTISFIYIMIQIRTKYINYTKK